MLKFSKTPSIPMLNPQLISPDQTALLVIDIQNDYCAQDSNLVKIKQLDLSPVRAIVEPLSKFVNIARGKGIPVIFTRMIEDHRFMKPNANLKYQASPAPFDLCSPDTTGFDYYLIQPDKNDYEIIKTSYDAFSNPKLNRILRKIQAKNLILTGAYTAVCVDSTLRTAYTKGYNLIVPRDLVSMPRERLHMHQATLDVWDLIFAHMVESSEIIALW